jgi:hypothetical protein
MKGKKSETPVSVSAIVFPQAQFTQVVEVVEVFSAGIFEVMNASSFAAASLLKSSSALA